jgi:hypothetical protein
MTSIKLKPRRGIGFHMARLVGSCLALAPLAPMLLVSSGRWTAGLGAGVPLMLLAALFGDGY